MPKQTVIRKWAKPPLTEYAETNGYPQWAKPPLTEYAETNGYPQLANATLQVVCRNKRLSAMGKATAHGVCRNKRLSASLDGLHQAMLIQGQGMCLPVGGAVLSKDVGHLQNGRRHHGSVLGLALGFSLGLQLGITIERIERAGGGCGHAWRHRRGMGRCVNAAMPRQHLDDTEIRAVFQQVSGETVPQGMGGHLLAQSAADYGVPAGDL
jgi:hypothetical protein